ncbi:hypothetical protein BGZ58_009651, partial [Dissophora ornata]
MTTPQDVSTLLGPCPLENIKVLALDLGQAYTLRASAWLPDDTAPLKPRLCPVCVETFYNLAVKPCSPLLHFGDGVRRERADMESGLPPLRGQQGSIIKYKMHSWNARKTKEAEYAVITDRLFKMVGGSVGEKGSPTTPSSLLSAWDGFSSSSGLLSLHGSF